MQSTAFAIPVPCQLLLSESLEISTFFQRVEHRELCLGADDKLGQSLYVRISGPYFALYFGLQ